MDTFPNGAPSRDSVLHEVLRALAQVLLVTNKRVTRYRIDTLELLVKCCNTRNPLDTDSRHAAVDALGNVLRVVADEEAVAPPFRDEDVGVDEDPHYAVHFAASAIASLTDTGTGTCCICCWGWR